MAESVRRIQAEFLDVGHVIQRPDGERVAVTATGKHRPGRTVVVSLSDGTSRRFKATEIVEVVA